MTQAVAAFCVSILSEFDDGVSVCLALGLEAALVEYRVLQHVVRHALVFLFLGLALVTLGGPRLQFRVADATDDLDACRATHVGLGPRCVGHHTLVFVLAHLIRT